MRSRAEPAGSAGASGRAWSHSLQFVNVFKKGFCSSRTTKILQCKLLYNFFVDYKLQKNEIWKFGPSRPFFFLADARISARISARGLRFGLRFPVEGFVGPPKKGHDRRSDFFFFVVCSLTSLWCSSARRPKLWQFVVCSLLKTSLVVIELLRNPENNL